MNLAIYLHLDEDAPDHIVEHQCHWRQRIGHLMAGNRDQWWDVGGSHTAAMVWKQLHPAFQEQVLPLLRRAQTLDGVRTIFEEHHWMVGAADQQRLDELEARAAPS